MLPIIFIKLAFKSLQKKFQQPEKQFHKINLQLLHIPYFDFKTSFFLYAHIRHRCVYKQQSYVDIELGHCSSSELIHPKLNNFFSASLKFPLDRIYANSVITSHEIILQRELINKANKDIKTMKSFAHTETTTADVNDNINKSHKVCHFLVMCSHNCHF